MWYDMKNAGRVPRPLRLGRCVRWDAEELQRWIDAKMPTLHQWDRMNEQSKSKPDRGSKR